MTCTITLGSHIAVQGLFVKDLGNGRVVVRVGNTFYAGTPVKRETSSAEAVSA